jgi:hypothetical protein
MTELIVPWGNGVKWECAIGNWRSSVGKKTEGLMSRAYRLSGFHFTR